MRKKTISPVAVPWLIALLFCILPVEQTLSGTTQSPQQVIESVSTQLQQKLSDQTFTKDFAAVNRFVDGVISEHTAFDKIAPLVLGKHWKTATPEEQARFKQEFQTLLVRTYSRAFVEYHNWTMTFQPFETDSPNKAIVKTTIQQPGQQPLEVIYRMLLTKGAWKVYDIMIDGVSLVTNYRSTFNEEIVRKGSISTVIDELAKRNTEALDGSPTR